MKIFCIGANKTGTSSLRDALAYLGVGKICPEHLGYQRLHYFLRGNMASIKKVVDGYDVFEDAPYNLGKCYQWLHDNYLDAKFILTVRKADSWFESMVRSNKDSTLLYRDAYLIHALEYGNPTKEIEFHKKLYIRRYRKRNREVMNYFGDNVLVINTEDMNWDDLCDFLDVPVPEIPFPHSNKGC